MGGVGCGGREVSGSRRRLREYTRGPGRQPHACRIVELPYQLSIEQYPAVHFGSQKLMAFP